MNIQEARKEINSYPAEFNVFSLPGTYFRAQGFIEGYEAGVRASAEKSNSLMEKLADLEHDRWSIWHMHAKDNWTEKNVARWDDLASKCYAKLSEEIKEKDRVEVRKYLQIISKGILALLEDGK